MEKTRFEFKVTYEHTYRVNNNLTGVKYTKRYTKTYDEALDKVRKSFRNIISIEPIIRKPMVVKTDNIENEVSPNIKTTKSINSNHCSHCDNEIHGSSPWCLTHYNKFLNK